LKSLFLLILLFSFNSFAGKYESDLKKVSKLNSFVDGNGNAYQIDQINNPEDTILILYSDGNEENINTDERMSNGRSWGTFKQMLCYSKNK
jgi:hypothetical protein